MLFCPHALPNVLIFRKDLELKARIDQFLSERRNQNTAFDTPAEDLVHMDTAEDVPEA